MKHVMVMQAATTGNETSCTKHMLSKEKTASWLSKQTKGECHILDGSRRFGLAPVVEKRLPVLGPTAGLIGKLLKVASEPAVAVVSIAGVNNGGRSIALLKQKTIKEN